MFGLGIRRDGFAMDVVPRPLEMIDPLVATEGGVARIRRPGVLRLFHFLRLRDIVFVLIILGTALLIVSGLFAVILWIIHQR